MVTAIRRPAEVFPPGEFLREELEERGWTQADLAEILGRPPRVVNEIIMGKRGISPESAKGLAAALGTSPEYWMNLEASYQLWHAKDDDESGIVSRRARLYGLAPLKEMLRRGWIEASDNIDVLEKRVRDFYEVGSLDEAPVFAAHAARKSTSYQSPTPAQTAWLFRASKLARTLQVGVCSRDSLHGAVQSLRQLLSEPQEIRHVPRILRDAGIRYVIVAPLSRARIDGACFRLGDSPVIAMSLRYDRIDSFWHTLMHEIGHIHNGDDSSLDTDLEDHQRDMERPECEDLADSFAVEQLIPPHEIRTFISRTRPRYSAQRIEAFAESCGVHPGIVVGQLQHRGELPWKNLRGMLAPVREFITETALTDGWETRRPVRR